MKGNLYDADIADRVGLSPLPRRMLYPVQSMLTCTIKL